MVCITGQVALAAIGTDAFQECDTTGITRSITKHNFLVTRAEDIPGTIRAFHIATTGRPGPVLVTSRRTSWTQQPDAYFDFDLPARGRSPRLRPNVDPDPSASLQAAR